MSIKNYGSKGTYGISDNGYVTYSRNTKDGHGGRAEAHRKEMQEISEQAVRQLTPAIAAEIYNEAITRLIGAIEYDIDTIVSVSVEGMGEIFNSSKLKRILSDKIMTEIKSRLNDIELKI